MRKSFKVATVFTGAAAGAAAGAAVLAPAAGAATATTPVTHAFNCTIGPRANATVLYWPTSKHHGPTCVSGSWGSASLNSTKFTYFCAGPYSGAINFPNGTHRNFGQGEGYGTLNQKVASIYLFSWKAGDTCAT